MRSNRVCSKCKTEYTADVKYCELDGTLLIGETGKMGQCEICKTIYPEGFKYCPEDGGAIKMVDHNLALEEINSANKATKPEVLSAQAKKSPRFLALIVDVLVFMPTIIFTVLGENYNGGINNMDLMIIYYVLAGFFLIPILPYLFFRMTILGIIESWLRACKS